MPNKQEEKEPKKEVLDLIGGSSKKKRAPQPAPAPAPSRPAPVKKEALDLLSGNKKKASRAADAAPAPAAAPAAAEPAAPAPQEEPSADDKIINLKPPVSVSELAGMLKAKPFQIIKDLMGMGIFANPNTPLDADAVSSICDLHGYTFAREKREKGGGVKAQQEPVKEPEPVPVVEEPKATLITRTPIITVMGHVDHGKTSLLDYIRKTRVAKGEAGGITQHIGAYTVDYNGSTLTFLDTPGHAIFTEMRARGADVTDIVVLVVAANDGIMPQTREAIAHSKAAGKTIIVAINKCDLPAADPVKTKSGLMEEGLVPTDFGGDVECVEVSALTGAGIDDLLGLLVLQSEVLELQANPKANCRASIIEARVEPGTGSSATAIVESGTIRVGMPFICGPYAGKVRALANDLGNLCNRSINMTRRYCDSVISGAEAYDDEASKALRATMDQAVTLFSKYMDDNMASDALAALNAQVSACNAYIEQQQPWQLAKDEASAPRLRCVLRHLLECCAQTGYLIGCVLPDASARILGQLNAGDLFRGLTPAALEWGILPAGHRINDPAPVFPRILSEEEKAKLAEKAARAAKKQG